jgi:hypothetical protein
MREFRADHGLNQIWRRILSDNVDITHRFGIPGEVRNQGLSDGDQLTMTVWHGGCFHTTNREDTLTVGRDRASQPRLFRAIKSSSR